MASFKVCLNFTHHATLVICYSTQFPAMYFLYSRFDKDTNFCQTFILIFIFFPFLQFVWPEIERGSDIHENKMVYTFDYLPAGLFNRAQVWLILLLLLQSLHKVNSKFLCQFSYIDILTQA